MTWHGSGAQARVEFGGTPDPGWRGNRQLSSTRLRVRLDPDAAVRLAARELEAVGFVPSERDLAGALRSAGAEWTGAALEIGANRANVLTGLVEDTPLAMFPRLRAIIGATLATAAARALPDGTTELIVSGHVSRKAIMDVRYGAQPRLLAAYAQIEQAASATGALVDASAVTPSSEATPNLDLQQLVHWE